MLFLLSLSASAFDPAIGNPSRRSPLVSRFSGPANRAASAHAPRRLGPVRACIDVTRHRQAFPTEYLAARGSPFVPGCSRRTGRCAAGEAKGPCCPDESEPYLAPPADYTPKGETVTVTTSLGKAMRLYVVGDPGTSHAGIIMAHDIFGGDSGRHKQLCDRLAQEGFLVCLPDLFHDSFPADERAVPLWKVPLYLPTGLINVLGNRWSPGVVEDVEAAAEVLRERGVGRIGMMGFCYGAWVTMKASGERERLPDIACGVSVHPSVHSLAPGRQAEEIVAGVGCPQLVLSTSGEPADWRAGGEVERWLAGAPGGAAEGSRILDVPDRALLHGFATRGDSTKENVRQGIDWVMSESLAFLREHLPSHPGNNSQSEQPVAATRPPFQEQAGTQ